MPRDGTTLRAQLADRTLNPSRNVAQGNTAATMIDIRLELQTGVTFNPEDVYDALVDEVRRRQGLHQPRHVARWASTASGSPRRGPYAAR
jgi:hypothetical protein